MAIDKPNYYTTTHPAIPYICISRSIPFSNLPTLAHPIPQLFSILASTTPPTPPAGPPFFRYVAIPIGTRGGNKQLLEMEVGVPVPSEHFRFPALDPSSHNDIDIAIVTRAFAELKALPAGTYWETIHVGAPNTLMDATRKFLRYAEGEGSEFDVQEAGGEGSLAEKAREGDGRWEGRRRRAEGSVGCEVGVVRK